jgi:hypothetical protein
MFIQKVQLDTVNKMKRKDTLNNLLMKIAYRNFKLKNETYLRAKPVYKTP